MDKYNDSAQKAWMSAVRLVYEHGEWVPSVMDQYSVGSEFGEASRATKEILASGFFITAPRNRLIYSIPRKFDLVYAIVNTIWTLTGSNDVDMISFYNPRGSVFSDDGKTLFAAPGERIFGCPGGNQFEQVIHRLKEDPTTRRAVIQIFWPDDLFAQTRDCSCTISLHFLLRNDRLHCIANMRSQSVLMVMPYDIFLFTMLQEAVASILGVEIGDYYHACNSLHYYEDEEPLVCDVLYSKEVYIPEMPRMSVPDAETLRGLKHAEQEIRKQLIFDPQSEIDAHVFGLSEYWTELLNVMAMGAFRRKGLRPSEDALSRVASEYRPLLII